MKKILIFLSTFIFVLLIPNLKVSALQYTSDIKYYSQILVGTHSGDITVPQSGTTKPEIILQINKTINCSTNQCVISIPFAATLEYQASTGTPTTGWIGNDQIISMFGLTYGTSANQACTFGNGTIDCLVPNGSNLPLIELFPTDALNTLTIYYTWGGFITVYDLVGSASDITNAINGTTNAVNDVNTSINNDSVSTNNENSSTASGWASNNASDSVVSDMVLMPITLLTAFSNGFNGTCQSYNLGSLYGTNLTLPCINISNYLGATLWGIIDVLMSGFLIYGIGKKFVRVFNDFTNLKDSQVDELYGGGNQ